MEPLVYGHVVTHKQLAEWDPQAPQRTLMLLIFDLKDKGQKTTELQGRQQEPQEMAKTDKK